MRTQDVTAPTGPDDEAGPGFSPSGKSGRNGPIPAIGPGVRLIECLGG